MNLEKYQQYSRIARGLEKADLVLKDARIVNVLRKRSSAETLPYRMGL